MLAVLLREASGPGAARWLQLLHQLRISDLQVSAGDVAGIAFVPRAADRLHDRAHHLLRLLLGRFYHHPSRWRPCGWCDMGCWHLAGNHGASLPTTELVNVESALESLLLHNCIFVQEAGKFFERIPEQRNPKRFIASAASLIEEFLDRVHPEQLFHECEL